VEIGTMRVHVRRAALSSHLDVVVLHSVVDLVLDVVEELVVRGLDIVHDLLSVMVLSIMSV
jgi:hypothetical protein